MVEEAPKKKLLIEAFIEGNEVKVNVIGASGTGLPILTHALKMIDMEITKQYIEILYKEQESSIIIPAGKLKDLVH